MVSQHISTYQKHFVRYTVGYGTSIGNTSFSSNNNFFNNGMNFTVSSDQSVHPMINGNACSCLDGDLHTSGKVVGFVLPAPKSVVTFQRHTHTWLPWSFFGSSWRSLFLDFCLTSKIAAGCLRFLFRVQFEVIWSQHGFQHLEKHTQFRCVGVHATWHTHAKQAEDTRTLSHDDTQPSTSYHASGVTWVWRLRWPDVWRLPRSNFRCYLSDRHRWTDTVWVVGCGVWKLESVWGPGFGVWVLGFWFWIGAWSLGCKVWGWVLVIWELLLGSRVSGLGFWCWGVGIGVLGQTQHSTCPVTPTGTSVRQTRWAMTRSEKAHTH